jgi:hypothetical protein
MHCSSPGCSGAEILKCTTGCKNARYCREACQLVIRQCPAPSTYRGDLSAVECLGKELGGTPLMAASHSKHTDIVKWSVKAGANPETLIG